MVKCSIDDCKSIARFNTKGNKSAKFCQIHKLDDMVNITKRICQYDNCLLNAIFGKKGGKGIYCATHKTADMIDIYHPVCEYEDCTSRPSFGINGKSAQYCALHKLDGMINVVSKYCEFEGCTVVNPVFGFKNEKGRFCSLHKQEGMIDVKHKRCKFKECDIQPAYGIKGGKAQYCSSHKLEGMIDLKNHYCEYTGCDVANPVFNTKNSKKGRFCIKHKTPDMIDVKHNRCENEDCDKRPNYDIKGGKGRFCFAHKLEGMIDVTHKFCEHDRCNTRPTYDVKGGKGRFCLAHKLEGMIDVTNKICIIDNCNIRARYGKPGSMVSHCAEHREKGMILKPTAKCKDCKEAAIWGTNLTPVHCEIHKLENEINLVEQKCTSCGLLSILDKNSYCESCNPNNWQKARLEKQNALMKYLDSVGLTGKTTDKIIDNGTCGKERPDRIYDFDDKIVIVECDENQHKDRDCLCEQTRMINISQSFGGIPIYFIRWNPDEYKPQNPKKRPENITKRYKLCADLLLDIKHNRTELPKSLASVIYLYYDNWSTFAEEKWQILLNYE